MKNPWLTRASARLIRKYQIGEVVWVSSLSILGVIVAFDLPPSVFQVQCLIGGTYRTFLVRPGDMEKVGS